MALIQLRCPVKGTLGVPAAGNTPDIANMVQLRGPTTIINLWLFGGMTALGTSTDLWNSILLLASDLDEL